MKYIAYYINGKRVSAHVVENMPIEQVALSMGLSAGEWSEITAEEAALLSCLTVDEALAQFDAMEKIHREAALSVARHAELTAANHAYITQRDALRAALAAGLPGEPTIADPNKVWSAVNAQLPAWTFAPSVVDNYCVLLNPCNLDLLFTPGKYYLPAHRSWSSYYMTAPCVFTSATYVAQGILLVECSADKQLVTQIYICTEASTLSEHGVMYTRSYASAFWSDWYPTRGVSGGASISASGILQSSPGATHVNSVSRISVGKYIAYFQDIVGGSQHSIVVPSLLYGSPADKILTNRISTVVEFYTYAAGVPVDSAFDFVIFPIM